MGHPGYKCQMTHALLGVRGWQRRHMPVYGSWVSAYIYAKESSRSALGRGMARNTPPPPSTHPANYVSGCRQRQQRQQGQHSRPMGQEQPSVGRNRGVGERAASAQAGTSWGTTPHTILKQDWEIPALGPGRLDPKCPS